MTLSGTAGHMTPGKFGFRFGDTDASGDGPSTWFVHGGRVFMQPQEYRDKQAVPGYEIDSQYWVMIDVTTYTHDVWIEDSVNLGESVMVMERDGSTSLNNWIADSTADEHVSTKKVKSWKDSEVKPRIMGGMVKCASDGSTGAEQATRAVYAMWVEAKNDTDPTTDDVMVSGVHPDTGATANDWSPFDANESCSAWVMYRLQGKNPNRIVAETKPAWTLPLYDANADASGGSPT